MSFLSKLVSLSCIENGHQLRALWGSAFLQQPLGNSAVGESCSSFKQQACRGQSILALEFIKLIK